MWEECAVDVCAAAGVRVCAKARRAHAARAWGERGDMESAVWGETRAGGGAVTARLNMQSVLAG